jgi:hypothetical protein
MRLRQWDRNGLSAAGREIRGGKNALAKTHRMLAFSRVGQTWLRTPASRPERRLGALCTPPPGLIALLPPRSFEADRSFRAKACGSRRGVQKVKHPGIGRGCSGF